MRTRTTNRKKGEPDSEVLEAKLRAPGLLERALAKLSTETVLRNAAVSKSFCPLSEKPTIEGCVDVLDESAKRVHRGDLVDMERTLTAQAVALDAIFTDLALRANGSEHLEGLERYLRLALRAQAQCRSTIEALCEIKYPRAVAFVRQANVGQNVQVNNGKPRAREFRNLKSELLEAADVERLDAGEKGASVGAHLRMEAMGTVDRPPNRRR